MKINWILFVIALGISALGGYGFYAGTSNLFLTIGGGLSIFLTLGGMLALSFGRGSINTKIVSGIFLLVLIVEHLIFAFAGFKTAPYIIITGILLLLYIMIFYKIAKALKE